MYDTIVIGAGQAGLAIGYYLKKSNKRFLLLDKGNEVGESWKKRYDSLVLFTPRMYSSLPGLSLNGEEQGFPSKDEIVDYLNRYVEMFHLPIHFNEEVKHISKVADIFFIKTNRNEYKAKNVVVAIGPFQTAYIPAFSKKLSPSINQLHSSQYKNSNQLQEGSVLIVGGGNSGSQIAVELSEKRETYLAVSRNLGYFPLTIAHKSIFWWFDKVGILKATTNSLLGRLIQKKGDPIFGFELKLAIKNNRVIVKNKLVSVNKDKLVFEDHSTLEVSNIIWATGFMTEYPWLQIEGVVSESGKIFHHRGVTNIRGLFFIGLPWQSRRGSALLQGVGYDAEYIARKINEGFYLF